MKKPIILVRGSNPDCIHREQIVGQIGTCPLCGQVRDYGPCMNAVAPDDFFSEKGRIGNLKKNGRGTRKHAAIYSR